MMDELEMRAVLLALGNYQIIRNTYYGEIARAVQDYLNAPVNARVTRYRNIAKRACRTAFIEASQQGFIDGGGTLPYGSDFAEYISARISAEQGYLDATFAQLRMLKLSGEPYNIGEQSSRIAENYAKTLDQIYNEAKARGADRTFLTFGGSDGKESCGTCHSLKGKRRQARWWVSHGLIPGQGNRNFDCGGFHCQHFLYDDRGFLFTI